MQGSASNQSLPPTRIIAVANQKGGVGKTTTVLNLAACLAASEQRTLIVDLDPQCNATSGLALEVSEEPGLLDLLLEPELVPSLQAFEQIPGLFVLSGSPDLVAAEKTLSDQDDCAHCVAHLLERVMANHERFETIFLDCPPSLNLLTLNALSAATHLLIPVQAEYFALEGLTDILESYDFARTHTNPNLDLLGMVLTMVDVRTNLSQQVESELRKHYGDRVFRTTIPRNVRLSESPSHGLPIILYDFYSRGARAYLELTKELIAHGA